MKQKPKNLKQFWRASRRLTRRRQPGRLDEITLEVTIFRIMKLRLSQRVVFLRFPRFAAPTAITMVRLEESSTSVITVAVTTEGQKWKAVGQTLAATRM